MAAQAETVQLSDCCWALSPRKGDINNVSWRQPGPRRPFLSHLAVELDGQLAQLLRVAHCMEQGTQAAVASSKHAWWHMLRKVGQTPASRAAVVDSGAVRAAAAVPLERQQAPLPGCPAPGCAPLVKISSLPAFCSSMAFIYSSPRTAYCALSRSSAGAAAAFSGLFAATIDPYKAWRCVRKRQEPQPRTVEQGGVGNLALQLVGPGGGIHSGLGQAAKAASRAAGASGRLPALQKGLHRPAGGAGLGDASYTHGDQITTNGQQQKSCEALR